MVLAVQAVHVAVGAEFTVLRRHLHDGHTVDELLVDFAVGLKILDGNELQVVLLSKLNQFGRAHHRAVVSHDFAAQPHFLKATHFIAVTERS